MCVKFTLWRALKPSVRRRRRGKMRGRKCYAQCQQRVGTFMQNAEPVQTKSCHEERRALRQSAQAEVGMEYSKVREIVVRTSPEGKALRTSVPFKVE